MDASKGSKRPFAVEEDKGRPPSPRRVRFPKGKKSKVKESLGFADAEGISNGGQLDPDFAAKERAKRRSEKREEEVAFGSTAELSFAEVQYEDDSNFEIDGIEIEPFNLKQELKEGYFEESGNFVEYKREHEIKDAWLDSVSIDSRFVAKREERKIAEDDYQDLSTEDIRKMKRRIAGILLPGETIVQALKRLKGKSNDKRAKMSDSTKLLFDQLTEDAMKLMENGEYNVYHEERETFERETASKDEDNYDMFGDDDDDNALDARLQSEDTTCGQTNHSPARNSKALQILDPTGDADVQPEKATLDSSIDQTSEPTTGELDSSQNFYDADSTSGGSDSDYVYDPSSGYYYNSNLGYYYDPASKLYCCATSGIWYSFDEQSGSYVEVGDASFQAS